MNFKRHIDRSSSKRVVYSLLLNRDTKDRLKKLCPEDISVQEMIRQILDHFVGIERPITEHKIESVYEEKYFLLKTCKKVPKEKN